MSQPSSDLENSNRLQQQQQQQQQLENDYHNTSSLPKRKFKKIKEKYKSINKPWSSNTPPSKDEEVRRNGIDPTVIPGTNIKKVKWFQSFGRWLLHQFGEPNFIKIHYIYLLIWIFVGSIMLVAPKNTSYIDAFFLATSASTQGGMNT